jgi:hypothetical protein
LKYGFAKLSDKLDSHPVSEIKNNNVIVLVISNEDFEKISEVDLKSKISNLINENESINIDFNS